MIKAFFEQIQYHLDKFSQQDNLYNLRYLKDSILDCQGRTFLFGNGGSFSISEHIVNELNKRCQIKF